MSADDELVRVLRVVEYVGQRDLVERQVQRSIHGTIEVGQDGRRNASGDALCIRITAVTLGEYPEKLEAARDQPDMRRLGSPSNRCRRALPHWCDGTPNCEGTPPE